MPEDSNDNVKPGGESNPAEVVVPSEKRADSANAVVDQLKEELSIARSLRRKLELLVEKAQSAESELQSAQTTAQQHVAEVEGAAERATKSASAAREEMEAAVSARAEATDSAESVRSKLDTVDSASERIGEVASMAETAAEQCQHIHEGHGYMQTAKGEIEAISTSASQSSETIAQAVTEIETAASGTREASEQAADARDSATGSAEAVDAIVKSLQTASGKAAKQESVTARLQSEAQTTLDEIEKLLPGATSTGLAAAFHERQEGFSNPERAWDYVFLGAIVSLFLVGVVWAIGSFWPSETPPNLTSVAISFGLKTPVVIPLVWLALHAAKKASEARRIKEDYAYKATLAKSFEGYKRQMKEVDAETPADSPLRKLCNYVLDALSQSPGRLYDAKYQEATPMSAVSNFVDKTTKGARVRAKTPGVAAEVETGSQASAQ